MLAAMDETTPAIQDYLGAIYDLAGTDKPVIGARLARHMHVSAPSITEALRRMQKDGSTSSPSASPSCSSWW